MPTPAKAPPAHLRATRAPPKSPPPKASGPPAGQPLVQQTAQRFIRPSEGEWLQVERQDLSRWPCVRLTLVRRDWATGQVHACIVVQLIHTTVYGA